MMSYRWHFACLPGFLFAVSLYAQNGCGPVTGTLQDLLGNPLEAATISIATEELSGELKATTDAGGSFRFDSVPCGTLRLTGEVPGFARERRTLILLPGESMHVALGMVLGSTTDPLKARLRGTVRWDHGGVVRLGQVTLMPSANPRLVQMTKTGLLGGYEVEFSNGGQYRIHVRTAGIYSHTVLVNLNPSDGDRTIDLVIREKDCDIDSP